MGTTEIRGEDTQDEYRILAGKDQRHLVAPILAHGDKAVVMATSAFLVNTDGDTTSVDTAYLVDKKHDADNTCTGNML